MEQPNSSEAFDADAERAEGRGGSSSEVDELRAEIARLKGRDRGREAAMGRRRLAATEVSVPWYFATTNLFSRPADDPRLVLEARLLIQ